MIFLNNNDTIKEGTAITVGMFDGVHLGHRALMDALRLAAGGLKTLVFTFRLPDESESLYTSAEKERLLGQTEIDYGFLQDCSPEFLATGSEDFIALLKQRYNARRLVVGEDFRFGRGAQGNSSYLLENAERFGIDVQVVPPVLWGGEKISSTRIRALVASGNVAETAKMLGGYYFATGTMQAGKQTGFVNFSAASINTAKIKPARGVYATFAEVEGKYYASVTGVDVQPAERPDDDIRIKTNIFDLESKPYNQDIAVHFVERLGDGMTIAGLDEMGKQVEKNRDEALRILQNAQKQTVYKPDTV